MSLLRVQDLTKRFGGLIAINDVSFDVADGEILSVIGPNGAGKSTLFKLIASFLQPTAGEVLFKGERISGLKPHIVARKGVVRTFQETTVFKEMTALENVVVAHHLRLHASVAWRLFRRARPRAPTSAGSATAPPRSSTISASATSSTSRRATCRTATSGRSASRSPWRPSPRSCCSTSRSPG